MDITYPKAVIVSQDTADQVRIPAERLVKINQRPVYTECPYLQTRGTGEYDGKAFYLGKEHDWIIVRVSIGSLVLIPLTKS